MTSKSMLFATKQFYRQIVENATDAFFICDLQWHFLDVNQQACRTLGYSREELLHLSVADVEVGQAKDAMQRIHQQAARGEAVTVEGVHRRKDGSLFPVELRISLLDYQGEGYLLGLARDISERKHIEAALQESEERFHELFMQNEDAIILCKADDLDIIDANPAAARLYGHSRQELLHLNPCRLMTAEDFQSFIRAIPRAGDNKSFKLERLTNTRKNGEHFVVSLWGKVIGLRQAEVVFCSIRDITRKVRFEEEMRSTQAKLIHANKMTSLGMLVSGVAHDINNPNTFIGVNAGILSDAWRDIQPILQEHFTEQGDFMLGGLPYSEAREVFPRLFQGLNEGSRRISNILANLKNFAQDDQGGRFSSFSINDIVRDAITMLSHHIHTHTDNFHAAYGDGLPPALGNAHQIEQVIINLVMNALQALPDKRASVRVSTGFVRETGMIVLTVADNGRGMSRDILDRITEPFFTTRLEQGGTGLGLSIAASIIKEHNGTLEFTSQTGSGTTAVVRLPCTAAKG